MPLSQDQAEGEMTGFHSQMVAVAMKGMEKENDALKKEIAFMKRECEKSDKGFNAVLKLRNDAQDEIKTLKQAVMELVDAGHRHGHNNTCDIIEPRKGKCDCGYEAYKDAIKKPTVQRIIQEGEKK